MDYCRYVNIFQGSGEINLPEPQGIARKWFFLKAGCGNTSPAATLPFGGMSVSPYTGGYPTGYGNHMVNTHSRPKKDEECNKIIGFTHLHQSGTGYIGYYYNYALTVPKYSDSEYRRNYTEEYAEPGYYRCKIEDILCEITVTKNTAFHRYTFGKYGGTAEIDFSNNGLNVRNEPLKKSEIISVEASKNTVKAEIQAEGIHLYFSVESNGTFSVINNKVLLRNFGRKAEIKVSVSTSCKENADKFLNEGNNFNKVKNQSYKKWDEYLSHINIDADEDIKEVFYSNLYHSMVKPCIRNNDGFIWENGPFAVDFSTLWDMYKTALPLTEMLFREEGKAICETLMKLGETLGEIPNNFGLTNRYLEHSTQARTLGCYVLMTAYHLGLGIDSHRMLKVIESDIFSDNKRDFTSEGRCVSHTFMLDMADCCRNAADIAAKTGETEIAKRLLPLSDQWTKCFNIETGLLGNDSEYYEGTLYNYSFRQMVQMDKRIEIAGGKEKFVKLLDKFFGYGEPDTIQPSDPDNYEYVKSGESLGRFEGFNNESDTESPYSYIYAGRHDRTCEIIRAGLKCMFTSGRGGLPGNNDSCALSSYYIMSALGIFPVAGQNLFLLGSPVINEAEILLFNGKKLKIEAKNNSDENIYVREVRFNNEILTDFMINADRLMDGGKLEFTMGGKENV